MEKVLVVPRAILFGIKGERLFQGFLSGRNNEIDRIIKKCHYFIPRENAENNHYFKQIVPYVVLKYKDRFFVYQRSSKGSDKRLHLLYSIGIGGHVNPCDAKDDEDIILNAMKREFEEEIIYPYEYELKKIGYINDDSDSVGRDHFGVVFLIEGQSPNIKVRETHKITGELMSPEKIENISNSFEKWSKIVWSWLKK
jgi:predicted NUDIX family phosphoesterase